ncbi:class D sortase [Aminipila butyrica]|nr:class D sortase [Aminipila butyrica]
MSYQQDKMYQQYIAALEIENSALNETFEDTVTSGSSVIIPSSVESKPVSPRKIENVIGRISIPSISSDQLLLEGSSSKQLKYGAGHVTGTALPGDVGNCSIAGHRNYTFGSYFNRLDEVQVNDLITIQYNNATFTYIVTESFIVEPDDVSILASTPNLSTLTLITCHPKGSNEQRLIIKGILQ